MTKEYALLLKAERERNKTLPGAEFDATNGPNDWVAIVSKYVSEKSQCKGIIPQAEDFEDSFIKAGAIIIAALEHIEHMKEKKRLK